MFISSTQQSGHLIKICCLNERRTVLSSVSCSVVTDCLCPHGLKPTRFLWPWNSPGKNTGMGCRFLLQRNFPTQGSNLGLLGLLPALQADSLLSELQGSPSACICSVRGWHGKGLKEVSSLGTWLVLAGLAIKQWFLSLPGGEPEKRTEEERITLLQLLVFPGKADPLQPFHASWPRLCMWVEEGGGNLCL